MKKKLIRLTESDLHRIVENSVRRALNESDLDEGWKDFAKGAWNKLRGDASNAANRGIERGTQSARSFSNGVSNAYNNAKQGMSNAYNNAKQGINNYVDSVKAAGQQASNVADANKAMETIEDLVRRGVLGRNIGNMVIGSLRKYGNQ